jgi:hypothetical protein
MADDAEKGGPLPGGEKKVISKELASRFRWRGPWAEFSFTHILRYTYYVARNLTLTLDEELLRAARKVAIDRNTSVNQMVRDYLERVVQETDQRQTALARLDEIFRTERIQVGRRTCKRQDLHER